MRQAVAKHWLRTETEVWPRTIQQPQRQNARGPLHGAVAGMMPSYVTDPGAGTAQHQVVLRRDGRRERFRCLFERLRFSAAAAHISVRPLGSPGGVVTTGSPALAGGSSSLGNQAKTLRSGLDSQRTRGLCESFTLERWLFHKMVPFHAVSHHGRWLHRF